MTQDNKKPDETISKDLPAEHLIDGELSQAIDAHILISKLTNKFITENLEVDPPKK